MLTVQGVTHSKGFFIIIDVLRRWIWMLSAYLSKRASQESEHPLSPAIVTLRDGSSRSQIQHRVSFLVIRDA